MTTIWPLGVFTSVDEGLGVDLSVLQSLALPTIQLHAPSLGKRTPEQAAALTATLKGLSIEMTVVFGGFSGESYADIPTTRDTVGLVPPSTRHQRVEEMKQISDYASWLACSAVGLHLGFIPHPREAPVAYDEIVIVTRDLCDYCARAGQSLHLETGQETAEHLLQFLDHVERTNLGVNFDPANMILYGTGDPLPALRQLGSRIRSVHCKDAVWSQNPGRDWGREVPLGEGDVGMEAFLLTLLEIGYRGPLTIEREIPQQPDQQRKEIGQAVALLSQLRERLT